jgi:hypothetical protein
VQHHLADVLGATAWRQVDGTAGLLPAVPATAY